MNQEKIGKFIAKCRKEKNMTQSELADKLGVTDKSIGNWENGRNMPDLSLFKSLCDELGITINEFLSGERIKKEKYQEKFEENIINTINYSTKKINISNNTIGIILVILGVILSITALTTIASDSSWGSVYSVLGGIISLIGICKLTRKLKYSKRLLLCIGYFLLYITIIFIIDYISVVSLHQIPRICSIKTSNERAYVCENPFYNVYKINTDTNNEYIIIDTKKEYTLDTVPISPFNRSTSGIDNIIKYKNKYLGNNSNTANLVRNLPLSEYGYEIEIDSKNLGLTINYHMTDWYINENNYLEKCLLYNSVSIFSLIDNIEHIKYNFSGNSYEVKRKDIESKYPKYNDIKTSKKAFNKYLEDKMNDIDYVNKYFKIIFN